MDDALSRFSSALSDRYAVERELGRGGMATVYLGRDLKHDRLVAIKVLRPELTAHLGTDRFLREIRVTARLSHAHILPLLDSGEAGGSLFYTMPFARGESLRDRLSREHQLPMDDALAITREVADAMQYAHAEGVIHRDIKPENILIENGHALVVDFGIARAIDSAGRDKLTEAGVAIGTVTYMSPEQASGLGDLDARSDIYSLGCVLYEMLGGQPPFTGPTAASVAHQHMTADPAPITIVRPATPDHVATALTRALAKTPADRFATASAFTAALTPRPEVSASIAAPSRAQDSARVEKRRWQLAGATLVVAIALLSYRVSRRSTSDIAYPRTSIAVLPLQNLSADPQQAYFAGGLHDELLSQLSKVATLKVISRTSVMRYAGRGEPSIKEIGRDLEVGSIVEASVQVVGNRLRVIVQLIDAATSTHLWADRYDRTLDDAFAIQSEVAQQIAAAVGAVLTPGEQEELATAPTANPEAYRLYLEGLQFRVKDPPLARQRLEQALLLDTGFALAHAALSVEYGFANFVLRQSTPALLASQHEEAEAALRLAPNSPHTHLALGVWHYYGRSDYSHALTEFRLAAQGLPSNASVWGRIGQVTRRMGRADESIAAHIRTTTLSPVDAELFKELAVTYLWARHYDETITAANRALALEPDARLPAVLKGLAYVHRDGQLDTLGAELRSPPWNRSGSQASHEKLALLYWSRKADSMLYVARTRTRNGVFIEQTRFTPASLYAAWAHDLRGDRLAARRALDSALVVVDSALRTRPGDERFHAARGLTLAGLGRRAEALAEANWLQQSAPYREDKYQGTTVVENRARILARLGDADSALVEIESLLARPSYLSVHTLRLDPAWDPIRTHPRFRSLVEAR